MGCVVVKCLFHILVLFAFKGYKTSPILTADVNDVYVNSSITLTCSTSSPPKAVVWFKTEQGSEQEERVLAQQWLEAEQLCRIDSNAMDCSCLSSQVYSCSIKSMNASNDGQNWRCKALNGNVYSESKSYTIRLIFPVPLTSLIILPETSVAYPVFNVASTFTCITSLSRPVASVYWFIDNRNITNLANYSHIDYVARSNLQYTSNLNGYSDGHISCVARYEYKSIRNILSANMSIRVQFPVSKPIVTINNLSVSPAFAIREGRLVHLKCSSSGYPQPSYNWTYPDGRLNGALLNTIFTRNNGSVSCKAFNVMRTLDGNISAHVTEKITPFNINVLYPPVIIKLSNVDANIEIIDNTIRILRGDTVNIVCASDANPPAIVSWHGQLIMSHTLTLKRAQHDAVWACHATNYMTEFDNTTTTATVTRNVSARVLYGPSVPRFSYIIIPNLDARWNALNASIKVIVGSTIILMCSVDSVPNSTFSWDTGHEGSILTIVNVSRTTKTRYTCTAKNLMDTSFKGHVIGSNYSSAQLDILFGAYVRVFNANESHTRIIVEQGETVELKCEADGDPEPVVRVINTTRGNERILVEIEGHTAKYHIQPAQCEYDTGNYTCLANNRYSEGKQLLALIVKCSPRASPFSPTIKNLYRAPNDSVSFTFTIIAYPKPTKQDVIWYKRDNGSWTVLSYDINYKVTFADDSMETQLIIINLHLSDFTEYMVNVSNLMGSTVEYFTLQQLPKPQVPTEFQVRKTGQTELVLEWIPVLNGGENENFTIRYKELDERNWSFIFIRTPVKTHSYIIHGLKPGKTYQIQMMADNTVGQSEWTDIITETTLKIVGDGSSTAVIGGVVGGVFVVIIAIAVPILLWRYRSHGNIKPFQTNIDSVKKYEDLVREPRNECEINKVGSYETCIFDSSLPVNQYEPLAELEIRAYSRISAYYAQQEITTFNEVAASVQSDLSKDNQEYVNLKLFA